MASVKCVSSVFLHMEVVPYLNNSLPRVRVGMICQEIFILSIEKALRNWECITILLISGT